jgi:hypothetical protein
MTDETLSRDMRLHLAQLDKRGIKLSRTQVWIYETCNKQPYSIGELAKLRGVSYQAIQTSVKFLASHRLLKPTMSMGKASYWVSEINFDTSDYDKLTYPWRGKEANFEELVWFFQGNDGYNDELTFTLRAIGGALSHLFIRAEHIRDGKKPQAPTGVETKSFLIAMSRELERLLQLLQEIIATDELFTVNDKTVKDWLGQYDEKTYHFIETKDVAFRQNWSRDINSSGFKAHIIEQLKIKDQAEVYKYNWKDDREGTLGN